jgi:hypothetical protein
MRELVVVFAQTSTPCSNKVVGFREASPVGTSDAFRLSRTLRLHVNCRQVDSFTGASRRNTGHVVTEPVDHHPW